MKRLIAMLTSDIKNIIRDETQMFTLFGSLLLLVFTRLALPPIRTLALERLSFDISHHYTFALSFLTLVIPMLFGFIEAFIILDERDENIIMALSVTPLSRTGYLAFRIITPTIISFVMSLIFLNFSGMLNIPFVYTLLPAFCAAISTPIFALFLAAFSANKVEGLALGKVLGVFLMIPAVYFYAPKPFQYIGIVFPQYWFARAMESAIDRDILSHGIASAVQIVLSLLLLGIFIRVFVNRVD